ncbi:hypothetical protein E8E14_013172 [Neopestalotiopsis sp. 37M]|nr:hypothetical protein E8E14_013172 [Neopestalotiopsis sp. 37M]
MSRHSQSDHHTDAAETQLASLSIEPKEGDSEVNMQEQSQSATREYPQDSWADEGNHSTSFQPVLPSELLASYGPPARLFTESIPAADPSFLQFGSSTESGPEQHGAATGHGPSVQRRDPDYAVKANALINETLGRHPGGTSVIEPESVLGDSGRLYHGYKDGRYFLPNDAAEQDRLDLQHHLWSLVLDGWLALAPMNEIPRYVLDVGTGTGLWAMDFAEQNPSSYVIGTDLSAIQPAPRTLNVHFTKDDAEDDWIFPLPSSSSTSTSSGSTASSGDSQQVRKILFDYVHFRLMFSCFNDPHVVLGHAYNSMAPGGWVEFQESALEVFQANPDFQGDAIMRWTRGCQRGAAAMGRDIDVARKYKGWLQQAGFVDVVEKKILLPMSPWPQDAQFKEIGRWQMQNMIEGTRGVGWKMLSAAGMASGEIEALVSEVLAELRCRDNHSYAYV